MTMLACSCVAALLLLSGATAGNGKALTMPPPSKMEPASIVTSPELHGAVGDGLHDDTEAVRASFADCIGTAPTMSCRIDLKRTYLTG